jgi:manganese efflux pump family protein
MTFIELFLLGLALSMDCFAVSITLGASQKLPWSYVLKMALFFGIFQGLMPLIGWLIGSTFQSLIQSVDHWIAFGILSVIGFHMIVESFRLKESKKPIDISKISILIGLSIATSIDALATGVGFGFIRVPILEAVLIITGTTFSVTIIGARLGLKSNIIPARWAEVVGGLVLFLIGLKILLTHLGYL